MHWGHRADQMPSSYQPASLSSTLLSSELGVRLASFCHSLPAWTNCLALLGLSFLISKQGWKKHWHQRAIGWCKKTLVRGQRLQMLSKCYFSPLVRERIYLNSAPSCKMQVCALRCLCCMHQAGAGCLGPSSLAGIQATPISTSLPLLLWQITALTVLGGRSPERASWGWSQGVSRAMFFLEDPGKNVLPWLPQSLEATHIPLPRPFLHLQASSIPPSHLSNSESHSPASFKYAWDYTAPTWITHGHLSISKPSTYPICKVPFPMKHNIFNGSGD